MVIKCLFHLLRWKKCHCSNGSPRWFRKAPGAFKVSFAKNLLTPLAILSLNPIPTRLFCAPKTKGGGGDIVPCYQLPFSESIQVKFLWKLVQNESFHTTLVSMETMVSILRWFIVSDFWLGIPTQKSKTLFPMLKVNKSNFFSKLIKLNRMTPFLLPWW